MAAPSGTETILQDLKRLSLLGNKNNVSPDQYSTMHSSGCLGQLYGHVTSTVPQIPMKALHLV